MIARQEYESERRDMRNGAWIAFQLGAGGDMTFGDYLESVGLGDEKPREPSVSASDAIAKAERILEMARERI